MKSSFMNTAYTGDCLFVMQGMNSDFVDLIYLDPPFNTQKVFMAPVGSKAAGLSFKDMWSWDDVDEEFLEHLIINYTSLAHFIRTIKKNHSEAMMAYTTYMSIRLIEMKRVLKSDGLIYFHCDSTASHYIKIAMDKIFGDKNFINEIIWQRNDGRAKGSQFESKKWGANTDTILVYSKSKNYKINPVRDLTEEEVKAEFYKNDNDEKGPYKIGIPIFRSPKMGDRPNLCYEWKGFSNPHPSGWRLSKKRLEEEYQKGNIVIKKNSVGRPIKLERRLYYRDYEGKPMDNFWHDIPRIGKLEDTGYRTQKPLKLMQRIIKSSSQENDLVFDPFCGTATSCVASEHLKRRWIGIDVSVKSVELVSERLKTASGLYGKFVHLSTPPKRTDVKYINPNKKETKDKLYEKQNKICNGCNVKFLKRNLTIDHKLPKKKGGQDFYENLQLLCGACNSTKSDNTMAYLLKQNKKCKELLENKVSFHI